MDGSFRPHHSGAISTTFTSDWYLLKGESRDKMGECLKKTTVRSPTPAEDAPSEYTQLPVELLATQDHENEGIE